MLITNRPDVAAEAERAGVDQIFIDLETLGKADRQGNVDTVKNNHELADIAPVVAAVGRSEVLVRVNPLHDGSKHEIETAIDAGADWIMLPMFRTVRDVTTFLRLVDGRAKTNLLMETPQALARCDRVLAVPGIDAVHVGLNDLNLGLGTKFLFEIVAGGLVDAVAASAKRHGVSFGFGGIARVGTGELPAEVILGEHARLGSERVILSRAFHNRSTTLEEFRRNLDMKKEVERLRAAFADACKRSPAEHDANRERLQAIVARLVGDEPGVA